MKNKKGLSVVVASVLMIVLVLASIVIVWTAVRGMIQNRTDEAKDCFKVEFNDKVMINDDYTCYNSSNESVYVSIALADEPIDGLLISIESAGTSKGFELTNEVKTLNDVKNYPSYSNGVKIPGENEGLTYYVTGFTTGPDSIRISPKVGEYQCKVTDTVTQIEDCAFLTGF